MPWSRTITVSSLIAKTGYARCFRLRRQTSRLATSQERFMATQDSNDMNEGQRDIEREGGAEKDE